MRYVANSKAVYVKAWVESKITAVQDLIDPPPPPLSDDFGPSEVRANSGATT